MSGLDIAIIVIVAVSVLIGLLRGFIREVLSLAAWVAALWVAFMYAHRGAEWLVPYIDHPLLRLAAAFAALFVVVLVAGSLASFSIHKLLAIGGASGFDRFFGAAFGAARGAVLVAVLIVAAGLTTLPQQPWWQQSRLVPLFAPVTQWIENLLPAEASRPTI